MREVVVDQFVQARPEEVGQLLDPAAIVSAEGSFSVTGVEETDSETIVGVSGPGIEFPLRFERNPDGYYYTADADVGPFDHMETWLTVDRENEGTILTLRSKVSLNLPVPFSDRLAGWKREAELERALESLRADIN